MSHSRTDSGVRRSQKADAALRASEVRYRRLFEAAHDGILILNAASGEITAVNPFLCRLLGYETAEIIGKKLWELSPFEDTHKNKITFEVLQEERSIRYDDRPLQTKDGRRIEVEFVSNVYESDHEHVIQCNIRDLTATRRADHQRRASEHRYRSLFEYAPDGILIADRQGRYVDANKAMCTMLGYPYEELVGLQWSDIVAAAEVVNIEPALAEIIAEPDYNREWEFKRRDASTFFADVMVTVMPDGNLMAFVRDNTARNDVTRAARIADERTRFALRSAHVGIWEMDYTTGVLDWSDELQAQYGIAPGNFDRTFATFLDAVHPDDRGDLSGTLDEAMRTGSDFSVLHRVIGADGKVRWVSGAGRFVLDSAGKAIRAVGISQDVTERHQLQAQFQQAQKMEAIGRLAGGVAHDFNNLLTVILGFCEIILEDLKPGENCSMEVTEIQKAGVRAASLTRQLLAFSRKEITRPTVLDLNIVLDDMRPMLARLIKEDVKIVFATAPALGLIKADRGQIEQIVLNLAVNAQDAMPNGGRLTIETANVALDETYASKRFDFTPGAYVALTVGDSGIGMPPEVIQRLFEPFFTTKDVGRGTGLGLASVHGIVTSSGGVVNVYSEVGHGSSFTVYLPQVDSPSAAAATQAAPGSASGTETVLLIEDSLALRDLTKLLLERQGYKVLAAANAAEAHRLFEWNHHIAAVLTDVVMPGCSGPELARQLAERRPGFKVIYMSGYTDEAIVQHGVLNPGVAFLHKPFTSTILGRKIRETLDT